MTAAFSIQSCFRPSVLVLSSRESLPLVEAMQELLDYGCELIPWSLVFPPSDRPVDSLRRAMQQVDFVVALLTADDVVVSRGSRSVSPRDNVLVELGLAIGVKGIEHTFLLCDRTVNLKLPTDLQGITLLTYHPPKKGSYLSALGAACAIVKRAMNRIHKSSGGARPRTREA